MTFANLPKGKPGAPPSLADLQTKLAQTGKAPAPAAAAAVNPAVTRPVQAVKPAVSKPAAPPTPPPEQEPVVVETAEGEPVDTSRALTAAEDSFLSLISGQPGVDTTAALMAAHDAQGGDGGKMLFPTLTQASGPAGGAFQRVSTKNQKHLAVDLPEGKSPFNAVFMAYRYEFAIWPDNGGGAGTPKPISTGAVPTSKPEVVAKLMAAGKAFQFSRGRDNHYADKGGPGVVKPVLAIMLFDPETEQVFVYRTPGHYSSAQGLKDQLLACSVKDKDTGMLKLVPFFGRFTPHTEKVQRDNATHPIVWHYPEVAGLPGNDAATQEAGKKYALCVKGASPELMKLGGDWVSGADMPFKQSDIDAFDAAIAIG